MMPSKTDESPRGTTPPLSDEKLKASQSGSAIPSQKRPGALGPSGRNLRKMTGRDTSPKARRAIPSSEEATAQASYNASEMEFSAARKAVEELVTRSMSAAEAGVRLKQLLQQHPDLLTAQSGIMSAHVEGDEQGPREGSIPKRELLPLPLPKVALVRTSEIDTAFPSGKVLGPKSRKLGAEAWHYILIAALNGLDSHGNCVSFFGPPTPAQASALAALLVDCERFVKDETARSPVDFQKELGAKLHSYWGEPVYTAQYLTLLQVTPTLPEKGIAASVEIVEVLKGQIRDQLRDPESLLLPEEEWPERPPKARTMLKDPSEWGSLANELWQRDLTMWLPEEEIFHHHGTPVVSGFFGVGKGKPVPNHPDKEQLRLICNLVPSNGYFREIRGDVCHLPYMMQWGSIILEDNEVLLISQEDMTCAFYLFRLPAAWCKYFAVGLPINLEELHGNSRARDASKRMAKGNDCKGRGYLVLQVLPMGWKSAVGIMQAVHRMILASSLAGPNRLPTPAEIRKTVPMPSSADQRTQKAWQVYLDNYASFLIALLREAEKLEGQASDWHKAARASWEAWNIPSAADKSVANAFEAKELGCFVDGYAGTLGTTIQRRLDAIAIALFLICVRNPHRMWLALGAGRWNFILQFRRVLSCSFYAVWRAITQWEKCHFLPKVVCQELFGVICLAPAMVTDLRTRPDLLITCSDASESGAALAGTAGLTDYGVWAAKSLPPELPVHMDSGCAVVSLFGGIEAGRRACDLLGVRLVRHIAVESDPNAIRATTEVYPDTIHFRDVIEFSRESLHNALAGVCILFVLVTAGFPCQGLSGANATKKGFEDPRSQLFFQALRVVKDVQAEKHKLEFLFENVASMDAADRDIVSHYLGVRPIVACAAGLSHVRRRRYLWASWKMFEWPGVTLKEKPEAWALSFSATLPQSQLWTCPGWQLNGPEDIKLPTFMRSIPKRSETYLPSGIESTPSDARKRWARDEWRYPPYQYKKEFCLRRTRNTGELRLVNSEERETLMFLGRGSTRFALNPTKAKQDPVGLEDIRCSLIGNSFHAGVVAMVLSVLFEKKGLLRVKPSAQDMVHRQGLYPGEVYAPGLICGLDRPPSFHRLDGQRRGICMPSFQAARQAGSRENSTELERKTLIALLRSSDYRGSDIRMDTGELVRPNQWPRRSIDPAKWSWYPIMSHPYRDSEHINVLEVRAAYLMLRWRSRTAVRIKTRFFHLLDSQVALAVLCKGRSSSRQMNRILKRIGALTVAAGFLPSWGYCMSQWNPSDKGSRRYEGRHAPSRANPRRARTRGKKTLGVSKAAITRKNRKFSKNFDSTLGYPGEGPKLAAARRVGRSRVRVIPGVLKRKVERVVGKRTSAERRAARAGISLREGAISSTTRELYASAFTRLWAWARTPPPNKISSTEDYDKFLSGYIEQAWESGATRGEAGNALSASLHIYPQLRGKGKLPESWTLLNAWNKFEVSIRAPPMPVQVAIALAWYFVRTGQLGGAFLILTGFDCFLRSGEMLSLVIDDVVMDADNRGVIKLEHTKTGQRHAAFEASTINDPACIRLFRKYLRGLPSSTSRQNYIFMPKPHRFYQLFKDGLRWLGLEDVGFHPYSLRRGGATAYFRATRNMEATLDRGRWASARVARIYVNDGLAREVELRFDTHIQARLALMVSAFRLWLDESD